MFASKYHNELASFQNAASVGLSTIGVVESQAENVAQFQPGNPLADEDGNYISLQCKCHRRDDQYDVCFK